MSLRDLGVGVAVVHAAQPGIFLQGSSGAGDDPAFVWLPSGVVADESFEALTLGTSAVEVAGAGVGAAATGAAAPTGVAGAAAGVAAGVAAGTGVVCVLLLADDGAATGVDVGGVVAAVLLLAGDGAATGMDVGGTVAAVLLF